MFNSLVICKQYFQIEMFFLSSYTTMSNNSLYKCSLEKTFKKKKQPTIETKKNSQKPFPFLILLYGPSWDA